MVRTLALTPVVLALMAAAGLFVGMLGAGCALGSADGELGRHEQTQKAVELAASIVASHPGSGPDLFVVGDLIRLVGYSRTTNPQVLSWLVAHIEFDARPDEPLFDLDQIRDRCPASYALMETGLPAVPYLLEALKQPVPTDRPFFVTRNHYLAGTMVDILGDNGGAILEAAIACETDPVARKALKAARVDFPTRWAYSYHELVQRTLDMPENPIYYDDLDELRAALTSPDAAVRHPAVSGILAERKTALRELTEAVRQPGPADANTIASLGQLRPRQQECIDALLDELEEAASGDGREEDVSLLAEALGRIGPPTARSSVKRIAKGVTSRKVEAAHARVIASALGRYSDEWIKAEIAYDHSYWMSTEAKQRLRAAQRRHQGLFTGDGMWGLP